jgi:ABC-2 type transport system ATP-binding protein
MPVAAALDAVDLGTGARDTRYEDCSGGQRRRTCVACALVNEPELLVLDEPTTGIDPAGRRSVRGRLDALADAGTTGLITTHDRGEADRRADGVVVLADGCVAEAGTPAEIVGEHGGPPRIVVGLAAGGRDVVRRARDAVADAVGVAPTVEDDRLRVEGVDATAVGAVVDALDAAGVGYTAAGWAAPTLEDAYLSLVDARRDPGDGEAAVAA